MAVATQFIPNGTFLDPVAAILTVAGPLVVLGAFVESITSATAGTRRLVLEVLDTANAVRARISTDVGQSANTTIFYAWGVGFADITAGVSVHNSTHNSLSPIHVPAGWSFRIRDEQAISSGDRVKVLLQRGG
jgi:hypothetical protein